MDLATVTSHRLAHGRDDLVLAPGEAVLAGGRSQGILNSTPGVPWVYEPDGSRIAARLEALGIMGTVDTPGNVA